MSISLFLCMRKAAGTGDALNMLTLCSDHGEEGHDHRAFLHVLLQTFHFPVSTLTF